MRYERGENFMEFFDCNVSYGMPLKSDILMPVTCVAGLQKELDRAGVKKALVWRNEHSNSSIITANEMLANDLKGNDNLCGLWGIIPSHSGEMPYPEEMVKLMKANRIVGWRLFPQNAWFIVKTFVLRDWLDAAVKYKIPIFVDTLHGTSLESLADLLKDFPELTVVLAFNNIGPADRLFRPFVSEYPNVYIDMTYYSADGGIEAFVKKYGAGRLLYGSGFPNSYFGSNMLMIRHAEITEDEKRAIAGGNLCRIIEEAIL
ncbi:MAG: amidohydrolase family protein [Clostridiales bacterium]|nr:amidohydrolase family protein [Clostridiales bacterium]